MSLTGRKSTATSGPGLNNKVLRYLSEHPIPDQPMFKAAKMAAKIMGCSGMGCSLRYLKTLLFRPGPDVAVLFLPVDDKKTGIICIICSLAVFMSLIPKEVANNSRFFVINR